MSELENFDPKHGKKQEFLPLFIPNNIPDNYSWRVPNVDRTKIAKSSPLYEEMDWLKTLPEYSVRAHHYASFTKLPDDLVNIGYQLTEKGLELNGNLVEDKNENREKIREIIINWYVDRITDYKYILWPERIVGEAYGADLSYLRDTYRLGEIPHEFHKRGDNYMFDLALKILYDLKSKNTIVSNFEESDNETLFRLVDTASIHATADVLTNWYFAKPDELMSVSVYPDEYCAVRPVGLHCGLYAKRDMQSGKKIEKLPGEGYDSKVLQEILANGILHQGVQHDHNGNPLEIITTVGAYRSYYLNK